MIAEKEVALLKEQELSNRLRAKDYGPAIALALELRRPHRLWGVLRDVMTDGLGERESSGEDVVAVPFVAYTFLLCGSFYAAKVHIAQSSFDVEIQGYNLKLFTLEPSPPLPWLNSIQHVPHVCYHIETRVKDFIDMDRRQSLHELITCSAQR